MNMDKVNKALENMQVSYSMVIMMTSKMSEVWDKFELVLLKIKS